MPALALVADDEPMIRRIVAAFLGDRYEVTTAVDRAEAERLLAGPGIAVAVLDCNTPGAEGAAVLARARRRVSGAGASGQWLGRWNR